MKLRLGTRNASHSARCAGTLLLGLALAACTQASLPTVAAPDPQQESPLSGDLVPVHDPAVIRQGDTYFLFSTGLASDETGIVPWRSSKDLRDWSYRGAVFKQVPAWAAELIPGTKGLWAPDIIHAGGEYRLYYSVSTFGKNRSAIGLATTPTLERTQPAQEWADRGLVVASTESDDFNAIDPNIVLDAQGRHWMAFGSFWSGIKMIAIDPETGMRAAGDDTIHSLARRPSPGAVEAPFVIRRGDYYYLFVSFDSCCRGADSTYNTVVGRSTSPTGPYVDRNGTPMMQGGGTMVLPSGQGTGSRYVGRGHVAILQDSGGDHIVYHAYDTQQDGAPTLRIRRLNWSADGWPSAD